MMMGYMFTISFGRKYVLPPVCSFGLMGIGLPEIIGSMGEKALELTKVLVAGKN
jgi:hypothetical protein